MVAEILETWHSCAGMRFHREYSSAKALIEQQCAELLAEPSGMHGVFREVAAQVVLPQGKRLRPVLLCKVMELLDADPAPGIPAACGIEFLHAASLMLDDLPCMDDASTRRGRPAAHRVFGEAATVLSAVVLSQHAVRLIARSGADAGLDASAISALIADTAGGVGDVAAGQLADLQLATGLPAAAIDLSRIYQLKTGGLFALPVRIGARLARASVEECARLIDYAAGLGVAFQILDDLIDHHATTDAAGKDTGQDASRSSAVALWGDAGAREQARAHLDAALAAIAPWGEQAWFLEELAHHLWAERTPPSARPPV
jgi:geranylgeranyl diphosphate synthase type II